MNFFLALFWLFLGTALLAWQARTGDPRGRLPLPDYPISYGWFMLTLSVYNLWRWWHERQWKLRRREQERIALAAQKAAARRSEETIVPEPPNPDFKFTDDPPL
jgi:hypothetical protein